jgi:hypothetical protein
VDSESYYWRVSPLMSRVILTVDTTAAGPLTISLPVKHARQLALELLNAARATDDAADRAVWSGVERSDD